MYLGSVGSPPTPVPMESQWIRNAIHMTANSIGLSVAYFMQKTAVTFGGCTMGSEYLLITFEDLVDPLLSKLSLPTLKRKCYQHKIMHPQIQISSHLHLPICRKCNCEAYSPGLHGLCGLLLPNERLLFRD